MKNNVRLLLILAVLGMYSCNKKYVTKIEHSYNTNKTKYYHKGVEIPEGEEIVKEGASVEVEVVDYNPLAISVVVNQEAASLSFQTNTFSPLMSFLKVDQPATDGGSKYAPENPFDQMVDEINSRKKIILDTIQHYKQFYNSIAALNNLIEQEKYNNKLNGACLCADLLNASNKIKKYFFDTNHVSLTVCEGTLDCKGLVAGDEFTHQKSKYFENFDFNLIVLDTLEARLKVEFDKATASDKDSLKKGVEKFKNDKVKLEALKKELATDEKERTAKNDKAKEQITALRKSLNAAKVDYLATQSNSIDLAVNKYKSIGFLEFKTNAGTFKAKETDEFKLSLAFENSLTSKTVTRKIDLDVTKPLKIDYSAGVFITPYLYDEDFDVVKVDSANYSIKKLDGGKASYGAIGYINFHPVFVNQYLSFGLSIGTGLMFSDATKIVFSPTGSMFIGKYQRVVVHAGLGFAQVDRIHSIYADDQPFSDAAYQPHLKKEISSSFLFGLTWNLSRK